MMAVLHSLSPTKTISFSFSISFFSCNNYLSTKKLYITVTAIKGKLSKEKKSKDKKKVEAPWQFGLLVSLVAPKAKFGTSYIPASVSHKSLTTPLSLSMATNSTSTGFTALLTALKQCYIIHHCCHILTKAE